MLSCLVSGRSSPRGKCRLWHPPLRLCFIGILENSAVNGRLRGGGVPRCRRSACLPLWFPVFARPGARNRPPTPEILSVRIVSLGDGCRVSWWRAVLGATRWGQMVRSPRGGLGAAPAALRRASAVAVLCLSAWALSVAGRLSPPPGGLPLALAPARRRWGPLQKALRGLPPPGPAWRSWPTGLGCRASAAVSSPVALGRRGSLGCRARSA